MRLIGTIGPSLYSRTEKSGQVWCPSVRLLSYHWPMLSELEILKDVCARLEMARIAYMLTGSMAMNYLLHLESVVKVDLIVRKQVPYRQTEFARRFEVQLPGFSAWLVSREDLILSKLAWTKDAQSELQMRDVRNLLSVEVDLAYLRQWAPALSVSELLEGCLRERHQP